MMRTLLLLLVLGVGLSASAQPFGDRYRTFVFDSVVVTNNVLFSEDVPQPTPGGGLYEFLTGLPVNADDTETTLVDLYMDIYEPYGDSLDKRPAVVLCFGGGFLTGSRDHWSIVLLAQDLAKSGFVVASIDYRLGFNVFDQDLAQRSVYRAIQDSRAAVKYLRANADTIGIDTNEVYIGGHSAGAFMALHNLYLDKESERPISTFEWMQNGQVIPDLGTLDFTGLATGVSGHANSAFSLAGALGFLSFVEDSLDGRTVMFHSEDDDTVPYDTGEPFGSLSGFIIGSDLPTVYGSYRIDLRCDTVMLRDTLHSYLTRGHGVHEVPPDSLHDDIIPLIGEWFHAERLKPEENPLIGAEVICPSDSVQTYTVEQGDAVYFDWTVEGGAVVASCDSCNMITVSWHDTSAVRSVSVAPYNKFQALGTTQTIQVEIAGTEMNIWTGNSGMWFDQSNWSLGRVPLACDDVVVSSDGGPLSVSIPENAQVEVSSMSTNGNVQITLESGAALSVRED